MKHLKKFNESLFDDVEEFDQNIVDSFIATFKDKNPYLNDDVYDQIYINEKDDGTIDITHGSNVHNKSFHINLNYDPIQNIADVYLEINDGDDIEKKPFVFSDTRENVKTSTELVDIFDEVFQYGLGSI